MIRTANPALNSKTFTGFARLADARAMTIQGTVNKTALLLLLVLLSSSWTWNMYFSTGDSAAVVPWVFGGLIGGFIVALITVFNKQWAILTAPIYSLLEGLALGGISAIFEARFPGIVIQAVGLTFGALFCLLMAYKSGMIKVTENFKLCCFSNGCNCTFLRGQFPAWDVRDTNTFYSRKRDHGDRL